MSSENEDYMMSDTDDIAEYEVVDRSKILAAATAWLKPTDYNAEGSEYRRHLSSHTVGTNEWLLSTPEWNEWHDAPAHGFLRLAGIPGSGKSVLAAHLAHRLSEEGVPVLFFFFRQIIDANHSPQALLRDWLTQLLPFSVPLQAEIDALIDAGRKLDSISMDDLWRLLRTSLLDQPKVYAIADALDEMDVGNEGFLRTLADLGQLKPDTIKVLVTSRPVPAVDVALRQATKLQVRLDEAYVDIDIARYVSQRLQASGIGADNQGLIRAAVPGRANGLFLYARLAMDGFLEPGADVEDVLRRLPLDLNFMYTDLLNEHARRSGTPMELQLRVLQWVTHASRPLRLLELSEIISYRSDHPSLRSIGSAKALVRAGCGPLIEMLPDETLSVCHHSLTEFLKGWTRSESASSTSQPYPILRPAPTHLSLAHDCLRYLAGGCLDACNVWSNDEEGMIRLYERSTDSRMQMDHPFSTYAAKNWHVHANKAIKHDISASDMASLNDAVDEVLKSGQWRRVLLQLDERSSLTEGVGRLHMAAWAGLERYARRVLDEGEKVSERDGAGNTPLHWAASHGTEAVASLLIDRGAKTDPDNGLGLKPLHEASTRGHAAVVSLLLQAGVDPLTPKTRENPGRRCGNAARTTGHTPLMYACQHGHVDTVNAFLPFLQSDHKIKALHWATSSGQSNVVRTLTQQPGFDADATINGDTALYDACMHRHNDIIHILLQSGADPNAIRGRPARSAKTHDDDLEGPETGDTPMHAFAGLQPRSSFSRRQYPRRIFRDGEEESIDERSQTLAALDALIKAGGDVNSLDTDGKTMLHHTCSNNNLDSPTLWVAILTRLLDAGADANLADFDDKTPLHMCLDDPTGQALSLLVERGGADINRVDHHGHVPLINLLDASGSSPVVLNLLKLRPRCDVVDKNGNTPLHLAMRPREWNRPRSIRQDRQENMDEQVVAALLAAGADPQAANLLGEAPLHRFSLTDSLARGPPDFSAARRIIAMLLEKGADLEAKDHRGETFLFRQVSTRSDHWKDRMAFLLDTGCDLHTTDFRGRGVLHEIIRAKQPPEHLEFCISRGADGNSKDHKGNSILHELASSERYENTLAYCRKSGISPTQRNNAGQTPLLIASGIVPGWKSEGSPFHTFLDISDDKDVGDERGVRPIHMASCVSEEYVIQLSNAGACMSAATRDGLNVLHVAARARQSNIVGLLCDLILASKDNVTGSLINAQDSEGRTPLHHACRSGRPETVAILLRAGASTEVADNKGLTPLLACVEFEEESLLWLDASSRSHSGQSLCVFEISQSTKDRPKWYVEKAGGGRTTQELRRGNLNEHDNARLDEILDLLISHGAESSSNTNNLQNSLSRAMRYAVQHKLDYTFNRFVTKAERLDLLPPRDSMSFDYISARHRVAAASKAYQEYETLKTPESGHDLSKLISDRHYGIVREVMKTMDSKDVEPWKAQFVQWGFASLLESTTSVQEVGDDISHNPGQDTDKTNTEQHPEVCTPLLVAACQRELPNIEVLKVLSQQDGFQINEQSIKKKYYSNEYNLVRAETALHELSEATHWWQAAEGIPFLLDMGADIDARDDERRTPLHVALLGSYKQGLYRKRAARVLIERGADVNAVDATGRPCLAMTEDAELVALLLEHGANRSVGALFNAVVQGDRRLLKQLLASGVNPNHRLSFETGFSEHVETLEWLYKDHMSRRSALPHAEHFILHYASTYWVTNPIRGPKVDAETLEELVRILLAHGADPYRTFKKPEEAKQSNRSKRNTSSTSHAPKAIGDESATEVTLIHEVLYDKGRFQPFLEISDLNLESRDVHGRTLLLAACHRWEKKSSSTLPPFADQLIDRGADLSAKDNDGNNALHLCLASNYSISDSTVAMLVDKASHLVREANSRGETPFHLAMQCRRLSIINLMLPICDDVRVPDAEGNSVLHHVAIRLAKIQYQPRDNTQTCEQVEVIYQTTLDTSVTLLRRFMDDGVDINSRNTKGETPFMRFLESFANRSYPPELDRFKSLLQVLRDAGADIFIPDGDGATALHLVAGVLDKDRHFRTEGDSVVVQLFTYLVSLGLDPFAEDGKSRTSLDVASANDNREILKLFEKEN